MSAEATATGLLAQVRSDLSRRGGPAGPAEIAASVAGSRLGHSADEVWTAATALTAEVSGLGPLHELTRLPGVTDILVNSPAEVWADCGAGLVRQPLRLPDEATVRALATRLAGLAGRRLDDACPTVDGRLPGGIRLHAVLPPVAVGGTKLSLRLPRAEPLTLAALVALGAVPAGWVPLLEQLMASRLGFLVSGGTGTGKTTVLGALLAAGDPADRVVIVEDTTELRPSLPHVVSVQARHVNSEGSGGVAMAELVRQALRMRPDRIVVGECRGAEVTDLLAALNTGHCGCGTVHANSAEDVPARLEALGLLAGVPVDGLRRQIVSGLQVVVHLERAGAGPGRRQLGAIGVVADVSGEARVERALTVGEAGTGPGWPRLSTLLGLDPAAPVGAARAGGPGGPDRPVGPGQ